MYMTRIFLDTRRRQTQRAFIQPNLFHGAIEESFSSNKERRLWRIDKFRDNHCLILVSEDKPALDSFANQYGYQGADPGWECLDYRPFLENISEKQMWRFRLRASPTQSVLKSENEGERGRIYAFVKREDRMVNTLADNLLSKFGHIDLLPLIQKLYGA